MSAWKHTYSGLCPDDTQPDSRDPQCAACRALGAMTQQLPPLPIFGWAADQNFAGCIYVRDGLCKDHDDIALVRKSDAEAACAALRAEAEELRALAECLREQADARTDDAGLLAERLHEATQEVERLRAIDAKAAEVCRCWDRFRWSKETSDAIMALIAALKAAKEQG